MGAFFYSSKCVQFNVAKMYAFEAAIVFIEFVTCIGRASDFRGIRRIVDLKRNP